MHQDIERTYKVLINDEEQYAIFPSVLTTPGGWREDVFTGSEVECVAYIDATWTDMRPRSLREALRA